MGNILFQISLVSSSKLVLIFATVSFSYSPAWSLDLETFVKKYLQGSQDVASAQKVLETAEENYKAQESGHSHTLSLEAGRVESDSQLETASVATEYKYNKLSASLAHQFPTGTLGTLTASRQADVGSTLGGNQDLTSTGILLQQSLIKNRFGRRTGMDQKQSFHQMGAAKSSLSHTFVSDCVVGIKIFLNAYANQVKQTLFAQQYEAAQQLLRQAEKNYKRRLITRLQVLSARADFINLKIQVRRHQELFSRNLDEIKSHLGHKPSSPLQEPQLVDQPISNKAVGNFKLAQLSHAYSAAQWSSLAQSDSQSTDLKLSLEATRKSSFATSAGTALTFDENYLGVSVKMDWPLWSPLSDAKVVKAKNDEVQAKLALEKMRVDVDLKSKDLESIATRLREEGDELTSLGQIQKDQLRVAEKKMLSGSIEVEDYIVFRDRFLTTQKSQIDNRMEIIRTRLDHQLLNGNQPKICGELQ